VSKILSSSLLGRKREKEGVPSTPLCEIGRRFRADGGERKKREITRRPPLLYWEKRESLSFEHFFLRLKRGMGKFLNLDLSLPKRKKRGGEKAFFPCTKRVALPA